MSLDWKILVKIVHYYDYLLSFALDYENKIAI